ncbi:MAG: NAD(P)/FAD-dependent oxidoreductase [Desulfobulbaceae bacterium]|nr:NAD(P)/FAD-dependent oxidoreductase [Desulfobulbaceae bacterium]
MAKEPRGAILQRDKKTYAIVPRTPAGIVSPEILEGLAQVVRKHNIPVMKITSGQRLALVGIEEEDIDTVWQELKMDVGRAIELCLHYVQACPGMAVCKYGQQDSLGLGLEIEHFFYNYELPAKVKIGVSGCPFCCGESYVRDIGVIGKKKGWTVTFGGNSGGRPRFADVLAEDISKEEVIELIKKSLDYYRDNGKRKERTARFIERTGIEEMRKQLSIS